jgi:dihydrofolate synthase/folylpolyglutamate synthase
VKLKNLKEAEMALLPYVPLVKQLTGQDTTLDRIRPLMELLGNPQDRLKIVHIAGTSGKTSTAYYMAALLAAGGQNVGLTVSPHVDTITERVQVNGQPLPEAEFCAELGLFLEIVQRAEQQPSYFELLYAFALWLFERYQVDYAVVETGMGGLHDATNIAGRADKVCIITDIGYDHMQVLGQTLPEITAQKIGIVHQANQVFMYQQAADIMKVVEAWTARHRAPLHVLEKKNITPTVRNLPTYQNRNWRLAYQAYQYLEKRDLLPSLTRQVLIQTQQIRIPGRMEVIQVAGKTLVMDGAHNEQKMNAFIASFRQLYPAAKPAILVALKTGKEYEKVVPLLSSLASHIIITTFQTSQDLPAKSMDPAILSAAFVDAGAAAVQTIPNYHIALQALLNGTDDICIITGSFYLLSQIRNNEHLV